VSSANKRIPVMKERLPTEANSRPLVNFHPTIGSSGLTRLSLLREKEPIKPAN